MYISVDIIQTQVRRYTAYNLYDTYSCIQIRGTQDHTVIWFGYYTYIVFFLYLIGIAKWYGWCQVNWFACIRWSSTILNWWKVSWKWGSLNLKWWDECCCRRYKYKYYCYEWWCYSLHRHFSLSISIYQKNNSASATLRDGYSIFINCIIPH